MGLRTESGSLHSYEIVEAAGTSVAVPDASLLFTGEFSRSGSDLVLTGSDGAKLVVTGYFNTDMPPALVSPQGAMLTGDVVTSLAGPQFPGQYAQAGGGAGQAAESIGKVQTLEGGATVVRANGVTETLKVGDPVFQGDVVMTGPGGKLGISFLDGTLFSLSNNARMVLNKLVYEPNGSDNSMLFNLVEGTFVFAAGKIAPTGDMKVQTPVATMGIRGTTPTVDIDASLGTVNFSIVPDPSDQAIGLYTLFSLVTGLPIGTVQSVGSASGESKAQPATSLRSRRPRRTSSTTRRQSVRSTRSTVAGRRRNSRIRRDRRPVRTAIRARAASTPIRRIRGRSTATPARPAAKTRKTRTRTKTRATTSRVRRHWTATRMTSSST